MAICQAHKLPKTHLESVTGKGGPIICGVDNLIGVEKKGGSTNSANFACAVSKQQVAGEEPSFPAEGLSENKRQRQNNLQEASAGRTWLRFIADGGPFPPMQVVEIRTDQSFGEGLEWRAKSEQEKPLSGVRPCYRLNPGATDHALNS